MLKEYRTMQNCHRCGRTIARGTGSFRNVVTGHSSFTDSSGRVVAGTHSAEVLLCGTCIAEKDGQQAQIYKGLLIAGILAIPGTIAVLLLMAGIAFLIAR